MILWLSCNALTLTHIQALTLMSESRSNMFKSLPLIVILANDNMMISHGKQYTWISGCSVVILWLSCNALTLTHIQALTLMSEWRSNLFKMLPLIIILAKDNMLIRHGKQYAWISGGRVVILWLSCNALILTDIQALTLMSEWRSNLFKSLPLLRRRNCCHLGTFLCIFQAK